MDTQYIRKLSPQAETVCKECGQWYNPERKAIGFSTCLDCGDAAARKVRHCIVPLHKSNYVPITDLSLLVGMNVKGGNVK